MMKIILAAAMLLTASLAAPAQMRLVADTLDLGLVEHGGRVSGTIMAVNTGTDTLQILSVHTDCGCTVADFSRTPVAPGDTAAVTVSYRADSHAWGPFVRRVKLRTSHAEAPYLDGVVTGRVKRPRHRRE